MIGQNSDIQQKTEALYPIESSQDFDALRPQIEALVKPRGMKISWSEEVFSTLKSAQKWAEVNGNSKQKLLAQYYLQMYYNNHLNDDKSITLGKTLLNDSEFLQMPESTFTLLALNSSYGRKGLYHQQLNIINQLIASNKKFGYKARPGTYGYYNDLAMVYYNLEQYELARKNFKKQAKVFEEAKDYFRFCSMTNNVALTYSKEKKLDSAKIYYNKALSILKTEKIDDPYTTKEYVQHFQKVIKSNIVKLQIQNGNFKEAELTFKEELYSSKQVKEPRTALDAYYSLANYYFLTNKFELALIYADSTIYFERYYKNPNSLQKAFRIKAQSFSKLGDNQRATVFYNRAWDLRDSLFNETQKNNYSKATAEFNFVETEKQLQQQKKIVQQQEKINFFQAVMIGISLIALMIIGLFLFKTVKSNRLIASQKKELTKNLREKEVMLNEIHHRIKNNLQMVSGILELQGEKIKSDNELDVFKESKDYIQSMFLVHDLLYEQEELASLSAQVYFEKLSELLITNYPNLSVKSFVNANNIKMSLDQATPLGLIACELIINSLKHAFLKKGEVNIQLSKQNNNYTFLYSDNGCGFNIQEDNPSYNTGMNLILILAEDLDANVSFPQGEGFQFQLNFTLDGDR